MERGTRDSQSNLQQYRDHKAQLVQTSRTKLVQTGRLCHITVLNSKTQHTNNESEKRETWKFERTVGSLCVRWIIRNQQADGQMLRQWYQGRCDK